jgi:hypothetical protein
MAEQLDTAIYDPDRDVVDGWNKKREMREWELSMFSPVAKLYFIVPVQLKNGQDFNRSKDAGDIVRVNLKSKTKNFGSKDIVEIGGLMSQTSANNLFRGGMGIKSVSVKYVSVEAGTFEVKIRVFISNISLFNEIPFLKQLMYPGNEFLLVYGWSTGGNDITFESSQSEPTIDLGFFYNGTRRFLNVMLHHFEWELGDRGVIEGNLTFFSPDTIRASLKPAAIDEKSLKTWLGTETALSDDKTSGMDMLYSNFLKAYAAEGSLNYNVVKKLKELYDNSRGYTEENLKLSNDKTVIIEDHQNVRTIRGFRDGLYGKVWNIEQEYVYVGWVLEALLSAWNTPSDKGGKVKIEVKYEDLPEAYIVKFKNRQYKKNDKGEYEEIVHDKTFEIKNTFFVPVNREKILHAIENCKYNLRKFMDKICSDIIDEEYEGGINLAIISNNNSTYTLTPHGDRQQKIAETNRTVNNKDIANYNLDETKDFVITYGSTESLLKSVKISSTIPPDLIWTMGLRSVSDLQAATFMDKALKKAITEKNSNPGYFTLACAFFDIGESLSDEEKLKQLSARIQASEEEIKKMKKEKKYANKAAQAFRAASSYKPVEVYAISSANDVMSERVDVGFVIRNYFNGLTMTIHGTAGMQAYKTLYFRGYNVRAGSQGLDGVYQVINLEDIVDKTKYETIIEAGRIAAGNVKFIGE